MAGTVHDILEISTSIYSVAHQVKANKERCRRLCERLNVLDAPLKNLANNPHRAAAGEPTLQRTLCVVTDARDLVTKYTKATIFARLCGAAFGGDRDEFDGINERLRNCVEALHIEIHVKGLVDTRDYAKELHEQMKVLVHREKPATKLREIDPRELVEGPLLGRGSFGEVRAGTWAGVSVAIKKLPPSLTVDAATLDELRHEATTHQQLSHPNVLNFFGACVSPPDQACLVVELAPGGSLYERIHANPKLISPALALAFAIDIVAGLSHLHRRSIFHRDLKSANVLIAVSDVLKLADFGLARVRSSTETNGMRPTSTKSIGNLECMAPELHDDDDAGSPAWDKVDVYALGIILSELISRKIPWEGKAKTEIVHAVLNDKKRPEISANERARHRVLVGITEECWAHKPADRLSIVDGGLQQRLVTALSSLGGDPRSEYCSSQSRQARGNVDSISIETLAAAPTKMVNTPHREDSSEPQALRAGVRSAVVADTSIQARVVDAPQDPEIRQPGQPPKSGTGIIASLIDLLNAGKDTKKERAALVLGGLSKDAKFRSQILKAGGISPLVNLLKTGTRTAKSNAACAISHLSVDANEAMAISNEGGIQAIVEIAKTGDREAKGHAVTTLRNFVVGRDRAMYRRAVVNAGGIVPLVNLAAAGDETTQESAVIALFSLTEDTNYRRYITESGCISTLINLLRTGTHATQTNAAGALCNLSAGADEAMIISKQGGIPVMVEILKSGNSAAKGYAATTLYNLVAGPDRAVHRRLVVDAGGIVPLVDVANTGNATTQEKAAVILFSFTEDTNYHRCIAESGGISSLINILKTGTDAAQTNAAGALGNLSVDEAIAISNEGGVTALVEIAKSGNSAAKGQAARTLLNFVVDPDGPMLRRIVVDAGGIMPLVELANTGNESTQEKAVVALFSLTDDTEYCRRIAESGGIMALENVLATGTRRAKQMAAWALSRLRL